MPTNWNILHKRFAVSVRDEISSASDDGAELSVADRDAYLLFAYTEYIRLISLYNSASIGNILSELFKTSDIAVSGGVANLPEDFGFFISAGTPDYSVLVNKPSPEEWVKIRSGATSIGAPDVRNIYISLQYPYIYILPATDLTISIGYIVRPKNIQTASPESTDDILLSSEHWDTIIELARSKLYRDKLQFDVALAVKKDAIMNAPFAIGERNATN